MSFKMQSVTKKTKRKRVDVVQYGGGPILGSVGDCGKRKASSNTMSVNSDVNIISSGGTINMPQFMDGINGSTAVSTSINGSTMNSQQTVLYSTPFNVFSMPFLTIYGGTKFSTNLPINPMEIYSNAGADNGVSNVFLEAQQKIMNTQTAQYPNFPYSMAFNAPSMPTSDSGTQCPTNLPITAAQINSTAAAEIGVPNVVSEPQQKAKKQRKAYTRKQQKQEADQNIGIVTSEITPITADIGVSNVVLEPQQKTKKQRRAYTKRQQKREADPNIDTVTSDLPPAAANIGVPKVVSEPQQNSVNAQTAQYLNSLNICSMPTGDVSTQCPTNLFNGAAQIYSPAAADIDVSEVALEPQQKIKKQSKSSTGKQQKQNTEPNIDTVTSDLTPAIADIGVPNVVLETQQKPKKQRKPYIKKQNANENIDTVDNDLPTVAPTMLQRQQEALSSLLSIIKISQSEEPVAPQRFNDEDVLRYFDQVKSECDYQPDIYDIFLDQLISFKEDLMNIKDIAYCISQLFRNHINLIKRFYMFLPSPFNEINFDELLQNSKKEINTDKSLQDDALVRKRKVTLRYIVRYLDKVKLHFVDKPQKYYALLDVMVEFKTQNIDTFDVVQHVYTLFRGHYNLIRGFRKILPSDYDMSAHSAIPGQPPPLRNFIRNKRQPEDNLDLNVTSESLQEQSQSGSPIKQGTLDDLTSSELQSQPTHENPDLQLQQKSQSNQNLDEEQFETVTVAHTLQMSTGDINGSGVNGALKAPNLVIDIMQLPNIDMQSLLGVGSTQQEILHNLTSSELQSQQNKLTTNFKTKHNKPSMIEKLFNKLQKINGGVDLMTSDGVSFPHTSMHDLKPPTTSLERSHSGPNVERENLFNAISTELPKQKQNKPSMIGKLYNKLQKINGGVLLPQTSMHALKPSTASLEVSYNGSNAANKNLTTLKPTYNNPGLQILKKLQSDPNIAHVSVHIALAPDNEQVETHSMALVATTHTPQNFSHDSEHITLTHASTGEMPGCNIGGKMILNGTLDVPNSVIDMSQLPNISMQTLSGSGSIQQEILHKLTSNELQSQQTKITTTFKTKPNKPSIIEKLFNKLQKINADVDLMTSDGVSLPHTSMHDLKPPTTSLEISYNGLNVVRENLYNATSTELPPQQPNNPSMIEKLFNKLQKMNGGSSLPQTTMHASGRNLTTATIQRKSQSNLNSAEFPVHTAPAQDIEQVKTITMAPVTAAQTPQNSLHDSDDTTLTQLSTASPTKSGVLVGLDAKNEVFDMNQLSNISMPPPSSDESAQQETLHHITSSELQSQQSASSTTLKSKPKNSEISTKIFQELQTYDSHVDFKTHCDSLLPQSLLKELHSGLNEAQETLNHSTSSEQQPQHHHKPTGGTPESGVLGRIIVSDAVDATNKVTDINQLPNISMSSSSSSGGGSVQQETSHNLTSGSELQRNTSSTTFKPRPKNPISTKILQKLQAYDIFVDFKTHYDTPLPQNAIHDLQPPTTILKELINDPHAAQETLYYSKISDLQPQHRKPLTTLPSTYNNLGLSALITPLQQQRKISPPEHKTTLHNLTNNGLQPHQDASVTTLKPTTNISGRSVTTAKLQQKSESERNSAEVSVHPAPAQGIKQVKTVTYAQVAAAQIPQNSSQKQGSTSGVAENGVQGRMIASGTHDATNSVIVINQLPNIFMPSSLSSGGGSGQQTIVHNLKGNGLQPQENSSLTTLKPKPNNSGLSVKPLQKLRRNSGPLNFMTHDNVSLPQSSIQALQPPEEPRPPIATFKQKPQSDLNTAPFSFTALPAKGIRQEPIITATQWYNDPGYAAFSQALSRGPHGNNVGAPGALNSTNDINQLPTVSMPSQFGGLTEQQAYLNNFTTNKLQTTMPPIAPQQQLQSGPYVGPCIGPMESFPMPQWYGNTAVSYDPYNAAYIQASIGVPPQSGFDGSLFVGFGPSAPNFVNDMNQLPNFPMPSQFGDYFGPDQYANLHNFLPIGPQPQQGTPFTTFMTHDNPSFSRTSQQQQPPIRPLAVHASATAQPAPNIGKVPIGTMSQCYNDATAIHATQNYLYDRAAINPPSNSDRIGSGFDRDIIGEALGIPYPRSNRRRQLDKQFRRWWL